MNLRAIDLNLLPVLEAIYAERSLTRASETLHITQPAVSNALSRLRAHFEDPLFVREGRGVKPTAMAEAMMPAVREALDRLRAGLEPRSEFEPSRSNRMFNISARDASAFVFGPALAQRLEAEAPSIRLGWSQLPRAAVSTELASGRLDLALDTPDVRGPNLERLDLPASPYVCVLAPGHALADAPLTPESFQSLRHIAVSSRREGRSLVEEMARSTGQRIVPVMRLPHHLPALEAVRRSQSALVLPLPLAEGCGLVIKPLPFDYPPPGSALFWHREQTDDPALSWLRGLIRSIAFRTG